MLRVIGYDTNMYNHVVSEVLISSNQCIPLVVLKTDTLRSAFVEAVEILDGCNDRIGGIMREYLNPHRKPGSAVGGSIEKQLESYVLGSRAYW